MARSGMVLVVDEKGRDLVAQKAERRFVPASVTKIVTAWLAMEVLGGAYRFKTRFYMDEKRVLYVRGGGDPYLVSEELAMLVPKLVAATGKAPFTGLVIDASHFPAKLLIPGITRNGRSYNAPNSALAVNFNTINAVRRGGTVRSGEKQTPITPLAIAQYKARGPKKGRGRISLAQQDPQVGLKYAGELIAAFVRKAGVKVLGTIRIGRVPKGLNPILVHSQSRPLTEILTQMLLGSNNFMANQVFLEVGARGIGGPASLKKSLTVARRLLKRHGLAKDIRLEEGSGISPGNSFTPRGMIRLLKHFAPHAELLRRSRGGSRYKTGSLKGVRTLAGFARTQRHGLVRFVIALGGRSGNLRFKILKALQERL